MPRAHELSPGARERLRHNVSAAMDALAEVADEAALADGREQAAFKAVWDEIDLLVAAEREALVEMLRDTQWAACDLGDDDPKPRNMCPECCALRERGHAEGCRLAALLG